MKNFIPKTLVIGAEGLLGRYFYRAYRKIFADCEGTTRLGLRNGWMHFDLLDSAPDILSLGNKNYRAAVIAAGITGLERCENNPQLSRKINVDRTLQLIDHLHRHDIVPIIFNSTAVFGKHTDDPTDQDSFHPLSEYARQKLTVEQAVRNSGRPYIMARLGKVFGLENEDHTYLNHMVQQLLSGQDIKATHDEIFCPTWVEDVVAAVLILQQKGFLGDINICAPETMSRYDLALRVADALGCPRSQVIKISMRDLSDGRHMAKYNRIHSSELMEKFSFQFTPMAQCLQMLRNKNSPLNVTPVRKHAGMICLEQPQ